MLLINSEIHVGNFQILRILEAGSKPDSMIKLLSRTKLYFPAG